MLDLPTAEERRRLNIHHKFKAEVYSKHPLTRLFIESEVKQAIEIMRISGKPVYCIETNEMYVPGQASNLKASALRKSYSLKAKILRKIKSVVGRLVPVGPSSNS